MTQGQNTATYLPGIFYTYFGEHMTKAASEAEQGVEGLKHGGSGGGPPRNARDTQVLLCTFGGIVIGCAAGVVIGITTSDSPGAAVPGAIVGFVIGGVLGSFVGEYLKRRKYRKLEELAKKLDGGDDQGPLIS